MHLSMVHVLRCFVFHFACFMLKVIMYDVDNRKCVYKAYCDAKEMKFRIFKDFILLRFSKKYFCGRPHEIYFRHPVRRKQSYIFFWPQHESSQFCNYQGLVKETGIPLTSSALGSSIIRQHYQLPCSKHRDVIPNFTQS